MRERNADVIPRDSRLRIPLQIPGDELTDVTTRVEDVFQLARGRGAYIWRLGETTRSNFLSFHDKFLRA